MIYTNIETGLLLHFQIITAPRGYTGIQVWMEISDVEVAYWELKDFNIVMGTDYSGVLKHNYSRTKVSRFDRINWIATSEFSSY